MLARITPAAFILLSLALPALAEDGDSPITWETSYSATIKGAADSGKPALMKFYTAWCPHCVRMDKTTWVDDSVAKLAESFVAGKINADVDKVPVKRYQLKGYPTVIVAEKGGEQVLRLEGYKSEKAVAAYLKAYLNNQEMIDSAFDRLRVDREDPSARLDLGSFYRKAGLSKQAAAEFERAMKKATGDQLLAAAGGAGTCLVKKEQWKPALKALEKGLSAGDPTPEMMLAFAETYAGLGKTSDAKSWRDRLLAEHGGSEEAKLAKERLASL
jgi:thioredoxin-like negative regulator of GroEL